MKCIIIEGPQGCGKTSLANYLRENIPASNLYRLAGQSDKTLTGKEKSRKMYYALLNYMDQISDSDINLIFDRTLMTEEVYSRLGLKEYDFSDIYFDLLDKLGKLNYDIIYISLYINDPEVYKTRLKREHHDYQAFSIENSMKQQEKYKEVADEMRNLPNTQVYEIEMSDFDKAYQQINNILNIQPKEWE